MSMTQLTANRKSSLISSGSGEHFNFVRPGPHQTAVRLVSQRHQNISVPTLGNSPVFADSAIILLIGSLLILEPAISWI